ncbi:hypothetical protein C1H46_016886 [Malus baccata]|uniref:Uncharacterized protein n=1 Tax=Malus baccata TaxID=106549 RepID=A0A540MFH0_MALBA|nr:hypothetical protein C1H46_016886 [Malus baccata]
MSTRSASGQLDRFNSVPAAPLAKPPFPYPTNHDSPNSFTIYRVNSAESKL